MNKMDILNKIFRQSKKLNKRIVLPEAYEERILRAAVIATNKKLARIILLGEKNKIKAKAKNLNLDLKGIEIIDYLKSEKLENYISELVKIRKHRGMTTQKAKELLKHANYFSTMMVKMKDADGLLSGAIHSTADTIRPAFQIIGTKEGRSIASGVFLMITKEKTFLFGDSAVNPNPNSEQLAEIALCSANTFKKLVDKKPKVAMLSFSTHGSAKHEMVEKVRKATSIAKMKNPKLIIDGDIQIDAAIVPEVAKIKCPESKLKGDANVLIFPDLNAGNIGYKIVERLAKAKAVGPILQGLAKPINDLSRGCAVDDIVNMIAITSIMED